MNLKLPKTILDGLVKVAANERSIKQLWLFGSRARGDHRLNSDIDVLVVGDDVPPRVDLYFEEAAGLYKIDVVRYNEIAGASFEKEINKDKILLYDSAVTATSEVIQALRVNPEKGIVKTY